MGHHIDGSGRFQSDKHPGLPPDRIRVSFERPESHWPLRVLAECYRDRDPELSADIDTRLDALGAARLGDGYRFVSTAPPNVPMLGG